MERDSFVRAARAALLVSSIVSALGFVGVLRGVGELRADPPAPVDAENADADLIRSAFAEVHHRDPLRQPVAAANAVLSVLLLVASFALMRRRPSAQWWMSQAIAANGLWTVVETASQLTHLARSAGELTTALSRSAEAADSAPAYVTLSAGILAAAGLGRLALYGWLWWRTRKPDIRRYLEAAP